LVALHTDYIKNKQFKDIQLSGPFRKWEHTHIFESISEGRSRLVDQIDFEPLFPKISVFFAENIIQNKLKKTFAYRHKITHNDLDMISKYNYNSYSIGVAGSNGLIGRELVPLLRLFGNRVYRIVRKHTEKDDEIYFDISSGTFENIKEPLDVVINLAGEPISEGFWTDKKIKAIYDSRVIFTKQLIKAITKLKKPINHFINASAIGFYGDSSDPLDENGAKGVGFIPDLCYDWESAAYNDHFPTAILRIGVVLTPKGGALKQLLKFTNLNLGATLGDGSHYISWIAIDDLLYSIVHILYNRLDGVLNLVAPKPVTQKYMIDMLAKKLKRLRFLNLGEKSVELIYGQLGREVLLANCCVVPTMLTRTGYSFYFSELENALDHLLGVSNE